MASNMGKSYGPELKRSASAVSLRSLFGCRTAPNCSRKSGGIWSGTRPTPICSAMRIFGRLTSRAASKPCAILERLTGSSARYWFPCRWSAARGGSSASPGCGPAERESRSLLSDADCDGALVLGAKCRSRSSLVSVSGPIGMVRTAWASALDAPWTTSRPSPRRRADASLPCSGRGRTFKVWTGGAAEDGANVWSASPAGCARMVEVGTL